MTYPSRDVDSGDVIHGWVAHRLLSQEHKAFGVVCGHHPVIFHHAHIVLIPVLPGQTQQNIRQSDPLTVFFH